MSNDNFEVVRPSAAALIQSLRAVGYTMETAIADIVDNSIAARASIIEIKFNWNGKNPYIAIIDNGIGMLDKEIIQAMKIGSKNPEEERGHHDLGRFGIGLKTASFSMCKKLTVFSKRQGNKQSESYCWDLDVVSTKDEWNLIIANMSQIGSGLSGVLEAYGQGTVVLLEALDRVMEDSNGTSLNHIALMKKMSTVEKYLSMVYHRFLSENDELKIYINDNQIEPWDPFLISEDATQELDYTYLDYKGTSILIKPYILPHHSKLTTEQWNAAEGPKGWFSQQGFYIYRNKRLLIGGTWFGLIRKEEPYKLARIMLDINCDHDFDWKIDIKKSTASPPLILMQTLRRIAQESAKRSHEVYYYRGDAAKRNNANTKSDLVWMQVIEGKRNQFVLNQKHFLLQQLREELSESSKNKLNTYLKLVQESAPSNVLTIPFNVTEVSEKEKQIEDELRYLIRSLLEIGLGKDSIEVQINGLLKYKEFPEVIQKILLEEEAADE